MQPTVELAASNGHEYIHFGHGGTESAISIRRCGSSLGGGGRGRRDVRVQREPSPAHRRVERRLGYQPHRVAGGVAGGQSARNAVRCDGVKLRPGGVHLRLVHVDRKAVAGDRVRRRDSNRLARGLRPRDCRVQERSARAASSSGHRPEPPSTRRRAGSPTPSPEPTASWSSSAALTRTPRTPACATSRPGSPACSRCA